MSARNSTSAIAVAEPGGEWLFARMWGKAGWHPRANSRPRPVAYLAAANLHHGDVDEHRCVDRLQWRAPPACVSSSTRSVIRDTVSLDTPAPAHRRNARRSSGRQACGLKRQHHLVDIGQAPLALLDDPRLPGCPPGPSAPPALAADIGRHRRRPCSVARVRPDAALQHACHCRDARTSPHSQLSRSPSSSTL